MVCNRCIKVVSDELNKLGIKFKSVDLGNVVLESKLDQNEFNSVLNILKKNGFELLIDKKSLIIANIKMEIIKIVHYGEKVPENIKFSKYLSQKLGNNYSYLSNLFSSSEGVTIERFLILHKVEKAKELIAYDELSLNDIVMQLGYSSVAHLSNQFKKVTSITPTQYKKLKKHHRYPLDNLTKTNIM